MNRNCPDWRINGSVLYKYLIINRIKLPISCIQSSLQIHLNGEEGNFHLQ